MQEDHLSRDIQEFVQSLSTVNCLICVKSGKSVSVLPISKRKIVSHYHRYKLYRTTDNKSVLLFPSTSFNLSSCISAWYSGIGSIVFFICDIDENSHSFKIMHQIVTVQWPCSRIICTKSQNQIALSFNGISVVPADTGTTEVGRSRVDQVISSSWYEHSIFCNCPCLCFRAIMQKCLVESHSCTLLR